MYFKEHIEVCCFPQGNKYPRIASSNCSNNGSSKWYKSLNRNRSTWLWLLSWGLGFFKGQETIGSNVYDVCLLLMEETTYLGLAVHQRTVAISSTLTGRWLIQSVGFCLLIIGTFINTTCILYWVGFIFRKCERQAE